MHEALMPLTLTLNPHFPLVLLPPGRSALHWAVLQGQTQLVHTLLEAGALVNTLAKVGSWGMGLGAVGRGRWGAGT